MDSFADERLTNAQMINAREIVSRLDSDRFSVTMFVRGGPAQEILARPNTRLIRVPDRLQTIPLLGRFLFGGQDILFYRGVARQSMVFEDAIASNSPLHHYRNHRITNGLAR